MDMNWVAVILGFIISFLMVASVLVFFEFEEMKEKIKKLSDKLMNEREA